MSLEGAPETKAKLAKLKKAIESGEIIQEAGKQWIDEIFVPAARERVPVVTGHLRDSIGGEVQGQKIILVAKADYAEEVEFGDGNKEAEPYFYPALDASKDKIQPYLDKAIEKRVK